LRNVRNGGKRKTSEPEERLLIMPTSARRAADVPSPIVNEDEEFEELESSLLRDLEGE